MRKYVSPQISFFDLRSEENIANEVRCSIGECVDNDGSPIWVGNTGS